jgi:hypothetical protein
MSTPEPKQLTQKRLDFCHRLVEGNSAADAYRLSFNAERMTAEAIRNEASKLLADPDVTRTVEELRADLRKRHAAAVDMVIQRYLRIAAGNVFDFLTKTKDGAHIDLSTLTREQAASLSEVSVEHLQERSSAPAEKKGKAPAPKVGVVRTRIKLIDPVRALDSLAKIFGLFDGQQPGQQAAAGRANERPQFTGEDHLADLGKRYAARLRLIEGAKPSDTAGTLNGAHFDRYGKGRDE